MIFIPNEVFFIIYQFVGPKSLYLNNNIILFYKIKNTIY